MHNVRSERAVRRAARRDEAGLSAARGLHRSEAGCTKAARAPMASAAQFRRSPGRLAMSPEPPRRPELRRAGRDRGPMHAPMRLADSGLVVIDATWGTIRPMQLADGVCTVGELEVMEHLDRGLSLIDTRPAEA